MSLFLFYREVVLSQHCNDVFLEWGPYIGIGVLLNKKALKGGAYWRKELNQTIMVGMDIPYNRPVY